MRKRRRYFIIVIVLLIFVFRGVFYQFVVTYDSVGIRPNYKVTEPELILYIEDAIRKDEMWGVESLVEKARVLTNKKLSFTSSTCAINPNRLIKSKKTNCVGYASFYAAICNHLLKFYTLSSEWKAEIHVGQLYFFGINIHRYIDSPFFKDHDFVIISNKNTGEAFYIDPSVSDYIGIDKVSIYQ